MILSRHSVPTQAPPGNVSISLVGNVAGWNHTLSSGDNPTITVHYGDSVSLQLTSVDVTHVFYMDRMNNTQSDCSQPIPYDLCSNPFSPGPGTFLVFTVDFEPGNYSYYCEYYPGSMHGTLKVLPSGRDFYLSPSSLSMTIRPGSSATSTVYVKSNDNFAGTVSLLAPNPPSGLTPTLNPSSVSPPLNGTVPSVFNLTVSASKAPGVYYAWIAGYNGSVTHSFRVSVTVVGAPDFSIATTTNSIILLQGAAGIATITIGSFNGFSGNVSLSDTLSPNGPVVLLNPSTVTIGSGASATSVLTVSTSATTSPSNYTITVIAINPNGQQAHSLQVRVTVNIPPSNPPPSILGIPTFIFGGIAAAVAAVSMAIFLARRRRLRKKHFP